MIHNHTILLNRKRHHLGQGELAQLIGVSQSVLSRIEDGQVGDLRFDVVLALAVVFGVTLNRMFPHRYLKIEEEVMNRAVELHQALREKLDRKSVRKLALLDDMMHRATANRRGV